MKNTWILIAFLCLCTANLNAQKDYYKDSPKTWPQAKVDAWYAKMAQIAQLADRPTRRDAIISGNQIRTIIWDNGSIGQPAREPSLEWPTFSAHGYGYEFGPFVGVEVPVDTSGHFLPYYDELGNPVAHDTTNEMWGATYTIISDGLRDGGSGTSTAEISPTGEYWTWEPVPGFAREPYDDNPYIALSNRPETWPAHWPSWPGTYQVGASSADQAAMYVMDDRFNLEYTTEYSPPFYPFPDDTTIGGMGLRVEVRVYQWSNPLARDVIFFVYEITNTSPNDYENVVFGMFGDPHIGGSSDYSDDWAYFDKKINMVYGYDADELGDWGGKTGWLGYMFLESPGNSYDGIDNDDDGLIDESMFNGIDDDGDWDPIRDDLGVDGVGPEAPYYPGPDEGEGDGVPTSGDPYNPLMPGEPNFDGTDLDEADQIGLTSFNASQYGTVRMDRDEDIWNRIRPIGVVDSALAFTDIQQNADNVFLYGSGYFPLKSGDTQRFSVALLMGQDDKDLFNTARIAQKIYNSGYRFAKAPNLPTTTAVAGDGTVTLFWDDFAEDSWDPVYGYDFEGYSVYRATDPGFQEIYTITDHDGNPKLHKPLARFDLVDGITGESAIGIRGVHFDLGTDTGLRHEFVDNTVINGITYYYAVVSYDYGDTTGQMEIPPSESTMTIMEEELTGIYVPDPNVVIVTPRAPSPGTVFPELAALDHIGPGTGDIQVKFIDPAAVRDGVKYSITFSETFTGPADTVMYVTEENIYTSTLSINTLDWIQVSERHKHLTELIVESDTTGAGIQIPDTAFAFNEISGMVMFSESLLGETVYLSYKPQPLWQSRYFSNEDANVVFDGIRLYVTDHEVGINHEETGWLEGSSNYVHSVGIWDVGTNNPGFKHPHSYEIIWQDNFVPSIVDTNQSAPFIIYDITYTDSITIAPYYLIPPADKYDIEKTKIGILSEPVLNTAYKTWELKFIPPVAEEAIDPEPGDIFRISINRPFTPEDSFMLQTKAATYDPSSTVNPLDQIGVVPNPYRSQSIFEPKSGFAAGRGDRQIQFINLPPICTIKIFTIAGELVTTIEHEESFWNGRESYNLLNKENMEIAYGVYIWHVDASAVGLGEKIGKFAVIK